MIFRITIALLFIIGSASSIARASVEGATYYLSQKFKMGSDQACSEQIESLSRALFGEKDEYRRFAPYSYLICEKNQSSEALKIEALFEPENESDRAEFLNWIDSLSSLVWNQEKLQVKFVNSIFWNTYGLVFDRTDKINASYEKPRLAYSFGEILQRKSLWKKAILANQPEFFLQALEIDLGSEILVEWKQKFLPQAKSVEISFYLYFLLADGEVGKSSLAYQMSRNCFEKACHDK